MAAYSFRRMTGGDIPMVNRWLETPAVSEWWIDADGAPAGKFDADYLGDASIRAWIVGLGNREFAFIQDYDPHAWPGHHFAHLPPGSRGIDQFIGDPEMIGRGHGSAFIAQHADRLMRDGAPAVGTDPHPDNSRAIRAYEKAGFTRDEVRMTDWGRSLLMVRRAL